MLAGVVELIVGCGSSGERFLTLQEIANCISEVTDDPEGTADKATDELLSDNAIVKGDNGDGMQSRYWLKEGVNLGEARERYAHVEHITRPWSDVETTVAQQHLEHLRRNATGIDLKRQRRGAKHNHS